MTYIIRRRFMEWLFSCVFFSFAATALNILGVLSKLESVQLFLLISVIIHNVFNVNMLRHCYFDLVGHKVYYISNLCAYFLFVVANIAVSLLAPDWLGTWLFLIIKFLRFTRFEVSALTSFIIFHIIGLLVIFVAPIRMKYIIEEAKRYNVDEFMLDWELNGFWDDPSE